MEGLPIITVITPTYNLIDGEMVDEFNILTTLLSKQTYPNIEHLVIDKASKDGTVQLLSDYKSKGYIQFYSEPDSGRFDALNKGIMRAKGKYVLFLNPGDFIHDIMALEEIVTLMEENEAVYSFGTSYALHPDGIAFPFEPAILNAFQVIPCPLQAMVFRKDVLSQENYFDPKLRIMADFDLAIRLIMKEYLGVSYEKNYVTYRISKDVIEKADKYNQELKSIYVKNFRNLYPLTNEILDNMAIFSEFPRELLEKLSAYYPEELKEAFFTSCEEMHRMRAEAANAQDEEGEVTDTEDTAQDTATPSDEMPQQPQAPQMPQQQRPQAPQQQTPGASPHMPPRPQMPNNPSAQPRPQGAMPRPQMPGMSGQPVRQTNPQMPPRPNLPGMNQP